MVTNTLFQDFALPDKKGNYFLRPDRILGAFIIPVSQRLTRSVEAECALAIERAADVASNQRLRNLKHKMETSGGKLRSIHQALYRKKRLGARGKLVASAAAAAAAACNTKPNGDDGGFV